MKKIEEYLNDGPLSKKSEWKNSPFVIFFIIGYFITFIFYALFWIIKWLIFSPIRPFTNSKWFCEQGFHKYRYKRDMNRGWTKLYKCIVCGKEKSVDQPD